MTAMKKDQPVTGSGQPGEGGQPDAAELELARQLAERARAEGLQLTGPGGLLGRVDQGCPGGRSGGRDGRPSRLCCQLPTIS